MVGVLQDTPDQPPGLEAQHTGNQKAEQNVSSNSDSPSTECLPQTVALGVGLDPGASLAFLHYCCWQDAPRWEP